ncbi:unnamed protein product [Phaedon cochleariae]|uniref:Uncharacterized protein n=1 Tax=Phaedon cochleariae TaxID=80249 RepID=A0A9N9SKQ1_PHACE|nr:unnamed protein product [Phaedon cochleariae]
MVMVSKDIKKFVLDDSNKISKVASSYILDEVSVMEEIISKLIAERAEARGRGKECRALVKLMAVMPSITNTAVPQASVNSKVMQPVVKQKVEVKTFAVAVKSDKGEKVEEIMKKVDEMSRDLKTVRVRTVRKIKDGVVIEAATQEDAENIRTKIKGKNLKIAEAIKINPKVIVFDVPKEITDAELLEDLYNKNGMSRVTVEYFNNWVKVDGRKRMRHDLDNVILSLNDEIAEYWIGKGYVYVGWRSCKVKEVDIVKRCFKCCSVHHRADQYMDDVIIKLTQVQTQSQSINKENSDLPSEHVDGQSVTDSVIISGEETPAGTDNKVSKIVNNEYIEASQRTIGNEATKVSSESLAQFSAAKEIIINMLNSSKESTNRKKAAIEALEMMTSAFINMFTYTNQKAAELRVSDTLELLNQKINVISTKIENIKKPTFAEAAALCPKTIGIPLGNGKKFTPSSNNIVLIYPKEGNNVIKSSI